MPTQKLYYDDAFLQEFTATVLGCEEGREGFLVTLDRTAFYPEGGGQPADHGVLGGVQVLDVHEKGEEIIHTCSAPLQPGSAVTGRIDWLRRFDHMQQHSGEHILSGILCRDYHCDHVGFHLGAETVTIDYNVPLTWEQVSAAEEKANAVIWADRPVDITFPDPQALAALDYRSKKALTGQVRIVTFPEADCCACCGTHVARAGQVGLVKVLSCQPFRDGVRMEILCGGRATAYFSTIHRQNLAVAQLLSVKPHQTREAVEKLQQELQNVKFHAARLEEAVNAQIAEKHAGQGDVLLMQPPMAPDAVRRLADAVAKRCGGLAAVFAGEESPQEPCRYHYALVLTDGTDISPLVKAMNAALDGRGGGRGGFAQGSAQTTPGAIRAFFSQEE